MKMMVESFLELRERLLHMSNLKSSVLISENPQSAKVIDLCDQAVPIPHVGQGA